MDTQIKKKSYLFGIFANQLFKLKKHQIADVTELWLKTPELFIGDLYEKNKLLKSEDVELVNTLIQQSIQHCQGNTDQALTLFGGYQATQFAYQDTILIDEFGHATINTTTHSSNTIPGTFGNHKEDPGRYTRESETARGGMGRILIAHDELVGRDVAIKELIPEHKEHGNSSLVQNLTARFLHEARITGQLEHPSIIPVYELGTRINGSNYYAMKFVKGNSFDASINHAENLQERMKLLPHYIDLCQALAYAHSRGVIHRDIKPSNVMVGEFGETVVIDWGLAKSQDTPFSKEVPESHLINTGQTENAFRTEHGQILGTPAYMSPEQALGKLNLIDERSDVYSLGAVLYELLTGNTPFEPGPIQDILKQVIHESPNPVRESEPLAPSELIAICEKALQKDPVQRYASAKELAEDIQRFQNGALVKAYNYGFVDRAKRFLIANKGALLTATAATVLISIFGITSYERVVQERDKARESQAQEEIARIEEKKAKNNALKAQEIAESAKLDTEDALEEAHLERTRAIAAQNDAEEHAYDSRMVLSKMMLDNGQYDRAEEEMWAQPEHLRNWIWGHLLHESSQDEMTLKGHDASVIDSIYSPDGSTILTISNDFTAKLWDSRNSRLLTTFTGHKGPITNAKFIKNGAELITSTNSSYGATVRIWATKNGKQLKVLGDLENFSNNVFVVNKAETVLYTADLLGVTAWSMDTHEILFKYEPEESECACNPRKFYLTKDDTILTMTRHSDAKLYLIDAITGKEIAQYTNHDTPIIDFDYSSDEKKLISGDTKGNMLLWDSSTYDILQSGAFGESMISRIFFTPQQSQIGIISPGFGVQFLDNELKLTNIILEHSNPIEDFTFIPGTNWIATISDDSILRIVDASSGQEIGEYRGHSGPLNSIDVHPESSYLLTSSADYTAKVWSLDHLSYLQAALINKSETPIGYTRVSNDGSHIASATADGTILISDTKNGNLKTSLFGFHGGLVGVRMIGPTLNSDGTLVAVGDGGNSPMIFDTRTGNLLHILRGHIAEVESINFNSNGQLLISASRDQSVQIWDAKTGLSVLNVTDFGLQVNQAVFSTTEKKFSLALVSGECQIRDSESGLLLHRLQGHTDMVNDLKFSNDGKYLISASRDKTAILWDVNTGESLQTFLGHSDEVSSAALNSEENLLVTTSFDGTAKIWDTLRNKELTSFSIPDSSANDSVWAPDGKSFYVSWNLGNGGYVRAYRTMPWTLNNTSGSTILRWRQRHNSNKRTLPEGTHQTLNTGIEAPRVANMTYRKFNDILEEFVKTRKVLLGVDSEKSPMSLQIPIDVPYTGSQYAGYLKLLHRLGLNPGDTIYAFDGHRLNSLVHLSNLFAEFVDSVDTDVEESISLEILTNGVSHEIIFRLRPINILLETRVIQKPAAFAMIQAALMQGQRFNQAASQLQRNTSYRQGSSIIDNELEGLWIGTFPAGNAQEEQLQRIFNQFLKILGLHKNDHIISLNGNRLDSIDTLLTIFKASAQELREGKLVKMDTEIERGPFHLIQMHYDIR